MKRFNKEDKQFIHLFCTGHTEDSISDMMELSAAEYESLYNKLIDYLE